MDLSLLIAALPFLIFRCVLAYYAAVMLASVMSGFVSGFLLRLKLYIIGGEK